MPHAATYTQSELNTGRCSLNIRLREMILWNNWLFYAFFSAIFTLS